MADVTGPRGRDRDRDGDRDRGQLILVTGLSLAVTLVAVVLLLNTVIYTENLATRGVDPAAREALSYRSAAVDGVGGILAHRNANETLDDWATLRNATRASVLEFAALLRVRHAARGTVAAVNDSTLVLHEGRRLAQDNDTRTFRSDSLASDWTLASNVTGARNVSLTVDASDLYNTSEDQGDLDASEVSDAFQVNVSNGTATWLVYVYRTSSGDVGVATESGGSFTTQCTRSGSEVTVNLTAGTAGGTDCGSLAWAEGVDAPYDVAFENGENATGTYGLTANVSAATASYYDDGDADAPRSEPVVYSAAFALRYETPSLVYVADVRVEPGDDGV